MANQQVTTRFAPSPTGLLHLGHLYAAQFAYDLAKEHQGRFLLRYEDIDTTRVRDPFYQLIEQDLAFANIHWDAEPLRQTTRFAAYDQALETLKSLDVIYPCFCTRKDIEHEVRELNRAPHQDTASFYPGTCRELSKSTIEKNLSQGKIPCWRINTGKALSITGPLSFSDSFHGTTEVNHHLLGDTILARKDIDTSYHIAVVVDDAFQNITDVTRGEDLLTSTHLHRILQTLLQLPEPRYHHHPLICNAQGKRLAKRDNALSIQTLQQQGHPPESLTQMIKESLQNPSS